MILYLIDKLIRIISDPFFLKALIRGSAAGTEHRNLFQTLDCKFIVDVGANRGQFALIARKMFPLSRIHSFEPLVEPGLIFQNIFKNDNLIKLYPYAIGNVEEKVLMHVSAADYSSSLLPFSTTLTTIFPRTEERETRQIQVFPLSHFFKKSDIPSKALLKIDVQGFELKVLEGCENIIDAFEYCYIECSFIELYEGQALAYQVISWLEKSNFFVDGIYNIFYAKDGSPIQGDFFFKRILT